MESEKSAMSYLKENKGKLSKTQYLTLKGQILSGNADAAIRGIKKIVKRVKESNQG